MGDDDVPTKIDALMDWQFFSGILKRGIGPQCYDPPVPFKCLLIGQWHAPSDAKLERALRVRLDFVVFCGPDLHAPLPDETTPCRFRNVLVRGGVYDDLPAAVCRRIEGHGLKLKEADAAFAIPALFDLLETEGRDDAVRIKGNPKLHDTDRMADQAPPRSTGEPCRAPVHRLPLPGREPVESPPGRGQGGVPSRRAVPPRRLQRHRPKPVERAGAGLLQSARRRRAAHKGGQVRAELNAALMHALGGKRSPTPTARPGLQLRQLPAYAGNTGGDRAPVADLAPRAADQDRRPDGAACPLCHLPHDRGAFRPPVSRKRRNRRTAVATPIPNRPARRTARCNRIKNTIPKIIRTGP